MLREWPHETSVPNAGLSFATPKPYPLAPQGTESSPGILWRCLKAALKTTSPAAASRRSGAIGGKNNDSGVPHAKNSQRLERSDELSFALLAFLKLQFRLHPIALFPIEKFGLRGPARQHKIGRDPQHEGRSGLEDQQPAPTRPAHPVYVTENPSREGRSNDVACGDA